MARNGSGTYNRTQDDYAFGEVISETEVNSELNDIAAALTQSLSKDGQTTATGNQPMGGFRHTGVGAASARDQYLQVGQAQDGTPAWCGTAGGTADARTLTPSPAITAYAGGQHWVFKNGAAANTSATPTVTISGLGTSRTVKRSDGTALAPGDMGANALLEMVDDGTNLLLMTQTYESEGADVASATTTNIWADAGRTLHITGNTTITSFGTAPHVGAWKKVIFDGGPTLTHGANLNLPGAANITTAAGDMAFVYADTTTQFDVLYFRKDGRSAFQKTPTQQVFTGSGTWTKPADLLYVYVEGVGGGGGGGGSNGNTTPGGGGGAGGYARKRILAASLGSTETVTIGAGGAGGTTAAGSTGGTTSFGAHITCNGGIGGAFANSTGNPVRGGAGGTASGGDVNSPGAPGGNGTSSTTQASNVSGNGGSSQFGGGGQGDVSAATGPTSGTGYGAGGGGHTSAGTGGAGSPGIIIVREYYQ